MAEAAEQLPPPQYPSPLERERESASFIASEMAALLYTQRRIDAKRAVADILRADPVLAKLRSREPFLSKKERFADQLEKTLRFWQMAQEQGWMDEDGMVPSTAVPFARDYAFPPLDGVASNLSDGMFIGAIRGQMSPEQQAKWLPLAQSHQILGTYAQTEMGHGSNVRGLETTATFDPATDEFVINSPTISSTKWWPGGLGLISTHAIVYARLIIGETDHGVFPFMVQLRSLEDHLPMPGVTLGTSGPTMGLYANEHGRCRFDHVRIPRDQFCARHNQVTAEGEFIPAPNRKVSYFTMVQTRVGFVTTAGAQLAKALTIAIRYSAVRRQGFPAEGVSEPVVLDYQMQQHIMFTLLSQAFALHFTARYMSDVNRRAQASDGGDDALVNLALLPELHATSAGLKAISTSYMVDGIEEARRACGGHGYGLFSGLPQVLLNCLRMYSTEGDNNVLYLQTARFLLSSWRSASTGDVEALAGNVLYYADLAADDGAAIEGQTCSAATIEELCDPEVQLAAFRHVAARKVRRAAGRMAAAAAEGLAEHEAKNAHMRELIEATKSHCMYTVLNAFVSRVSDIEDGTLGRVLKTQCDLYALHTMEANIGDFVNDGYLSGEQADLVSDGVVALLGVVRPDAVALVDSFDFDDELELHNSAIGSQDGDVYTRLYEWSNKDPLNGEAGDGAVVEGAEEMLLPFMRMNAKL